MAQFLWTIWVHDHECALKGEEQQVAFGMMNNTAQITPPMCLELMEPCKFKSKEVRGTPS